jgi:DUF4097 and DUF4098 domain-containing protein YvlB
MVKGVRVLLVLSLLFLSTIGGCRNFQAIEQKSFESRYNITNISEIQVELHAGRINVVGGDSQELILNASIADPDSFIEKQQGSRLFVSLVDSEGDDELSLLVPTGIVVKVETFSADISLVDFTGEIALSSAAGNIRLDLFSGDAQLRAGRGNVDLRNGDGDVVIIGEHGILSASGFDGNLSMSTIMGTLKYLAAEGAHGSTALESDHGPIEVLLPESSHLDIRVNTTSGYVTCLGSDLIQTVDGCVGRVGEGTGELVVRTVSGRVDLKVLTTE